MSRSQEGDGMVAFSSVRTAPWAVAVAANALVVSIVIEAFPPFVSPAHAQEEIGAETGEAISTGTSTAGPETTEPEATEPETTEPEATEPETSGEEEEEEKKGPYHNKVQGKLRFEVLFGPSRFNPDAFSVAASGGIALPDSPKVKGPEFGVTLLGGPSTSTHFVGGLYRQANYDFYKLMKAGLANQWAWRTPYVHPMVRLDVAYAHIFDGDIYPGLDGSPRHGISTTFGFGVRVPIVRWVSFAATFDWSLVSLFAKGDVTNLLGSQIVGTFSLMGHFIGVDENR